MRQIDDLHLQYLFAGARMLRESLRPGGGTIGQCVVSLMRRMGITAAYQPTVSFPPDLPISPARSRTYLKIENRLFEGSYSRDVNGSPPAFPVNLTTFSCPCLECRGYAS